MTFNFRTWPVQSLDLHAVTPGTAPPNSSSNRLCAAGRLVLARIIQLAVGHS